MRAGALRRAPAMPAACPPQRDRDGSMGPEFLGAASAAAAGQDRIGGRGWAMIAAGALVIMVVVVYARLAYGFILPFMRSGLGLTYQQAGALGTASALGYLVLIMVAGMAAARWGGRAAVLCGVAMTA